MDLGMKPFEYRDRFTLYIKLPDLLGGLKEL
jgi:hypothetical protein